MERIFIALIVVILAIIIAPIWYLGHAFWVTANVPLHQTAFWAILVIAPGSLFWAHWSKYIPWRMNWKIMLPLWGIFFFVYYTTGMFYMSGIADTSLINAQAIGGKWEESYTAIRTETVCDATDKDGRCTSSHVNTYCDDHRSDSFSVLFSDGSEHSINRGNYKSLKGQFGNQKQVPILHLDQCSMGDGRKFVTNFEAGKSAELYVSYEIPVVNYILANSNLYKKSLTIAKPFTQYLQPVPGIIEHPAGIGPWRSNRLIVSSVQIPNDWQIKTENELNKLNGILGPKKEINTVMYIISINDPDFRHALEAYWVHGKKNQLTIIVGSEHFPKIDRVDVIDFWSQKEILHVDMERRLGEISLDDPKLMQIIEEEIRKGWNRRHMKSFEYLAWDLSLPWWSYVLITLGSILLAAFFSRAIEDSLDSI